MQIALSTYFLPHLPFEKAVRELLEAGGEAVEVIWDLPHFGPNGDPLASRKFLQKLHVPLSVHAPFFDLNLASAYKEIREVALRRLKDCVDFCGDVGATPMVVHPGYSLFRDFKEVFKEARKRFEETLEELVDYGRKRGTKVSVENVQSPYFMVWRAEELEHLCQNLGVGATLDIGHAYITERQLGSSRPEEGIVQAIKRLSPFLDHLHLHDNHGDKDEHLALGKGKIDFGPIVKSLNLIGFQGKLVLEAWHPERSKERAVEEVRKLKSLLKN